MFVKRKTHAKSGLVALGISCAVTEARRTVTVVSPVTAYIFDFHVCVRVDSWQFVSQLVIKARMYNRLWPFR